LYFIVILLEFLNYLHRFAIFSMHHTHSSKDELSIPTLFRRDYIIERVDSLVNLAQNIAQPATNCNTIFSECKLEYGFVLTTY
jgi:hypothetical protein